jgi:anti-repressor protein
VDGLVAVGTGAGDPRPLEDTRVTDLALTLNWEGHRVRMAGTPERPEWVAKDVCRVLLLRNTSQALADAGVTEAEKGISRTDTPGGPQDLTTVTESALWKMVMTSRKPGAMRFKAWLASDVVPCIRKHGLYPAPPERSALPPLDLHDIRQLAPLALQLAHLVQEQQQQLTEQAPKVEGYDRLAAARGHYSLMDAGRILGRKPLLFVRQLLADGLLFRGGDGTPEPAHEYRERGFFRVRSIVDDEQHTRRQTLVTPTGLQWLAGRYPSTDPAGEFAERSH